MISEAMIGKHRLKWIQTILVYIGFLLIWWITVDKTRFVSVRTFPSLSGVIASADKLVKYGYAGTSLASDVLSSLELLLASLIVASIFGTALGLLMGTSRKIYWLINPLFNLFRSISPIAWIPIAILWFGINPRAEGFIILYAAITPCIINTIVGVRSLDSSLTEYALVAGAGRWRRVKSVVIPGALPSIMTGIRLSLQISWMALVAAELVGSKAGIGHIMIIASRELQPNIVLIGMLLIALCAGVMDLGIRRLEAKFISW